MSCPVRKRLDHTSRCWSRRGLVGQDLRAGRFHHGQLEIEEFLKTEEAEILAEIQHYFAAAKQKGGEIRFEQRTLWANIENRVDAGITGTCADKDLHRELLGRAKEAILHPMRNLIAKTVRESLGKP